MFDCYHKKYILSLFDTKIIGIRALVCAYHNTNIFFKQVANITKTDIGSSWSTKSIALIDPHVFPFSIIFSIHTSNQRTLSLHYLMSKLQLASTEDMDQAGLFAERDYCL